jgi:hypothetical protein
LTFNFKPVTEQLVEKKLKQLKRSKAAGIDNIPPGILKDCSSVVRKPLAHIINMSLFTGEIPKEWKEAKVIPINKKGSTNDFDNYRPISVLPAITKIAGRIDLPQVSLEWVLIGYIQFIMRSVLNLKRRTRETCKTRHSLIFTGQNPVR